MGGVVTTNGRAHLRSSLAPSASPRLQLTSTPPCSAGFRRYLDQSQVKKLKRMRRAIRNRESATASRLRRKEYIESLEKRTSELCSENAMLDLSVTEMQMREKKKNEELSSLRDETGRLREDMVKRQAEMEQLRLDNLAIEVSLKNVKLVDDDDEVASPGQTSPLALCREGQDPTSTSTSTGPSTSTSKSRPLAPSARGGGHAQKLSCTTRGAVQLVHAVRCEKKNHGLNLQQSHSESSALTLAPQL